MEQFIAKYRDQIQGVLSGFDRLIFRGSLRRLNYGHWDRNLEAQVAEGMEQYLWTNKILFKDYARQVKWSPVRRLSTGARIWWHACGPVTCCTTTRFTRRPDGCTPASRRGFPSTFRSESTGGSGWLGRWIRRG